MNPLTLVKRIQNINSKEAALGISDEASWHAKYKDSAYVFVGGIPFDLTEGDLLAVFAQYGEVVDVNLVRDKGTGKSKGFAFVAYEDQRSTNLAVGLCLLLFPSLYNLNGAQILGRIIRVDHVSKYKKKEEEDEETEQRKREERGVCRAFQRGECTRGAGCKFSHNEQRAANTGWGHDDKEPRWGHDKFDGPKMGDRRSGNLPSNNVPEHPAKGGFSIGNKDSSFKARGNGALESQSKQIDTRDEKRLGSYGNTDDFDRRSRDHDTREGKRSRRHIDDEFQPKSREDHDRRDEKRLRRHGADDEHVEKSREDIDRREEMKPRRHDDYEYQPKSREDHYKREEKRSRRHNDDDFQPNLRGEQDKREGQNSRMRDYDQIEPKSRDLKSREVNYRREEKRSGRYDDDKYESKSRKDYERSEDRRSRIPKA
ncbi:zinc finger CCCH domain-containing protein 25 isoform X1 [Ziziphus jujuba]|uniref:Zinc finger CCCH domain-containing protein 25 isoform X1 n=2 Tax=Ziziphus jujuba TaxID=326968 RepID=A0A6P6FZS7_ZIZJJ|nr:zinc finger CCCH domain-containing protein 25 isoform X1 [Ziziphus jujuba]